MKDYHNTLHNFAEPVEAFMQKIFTAIHVDGPAISPEKINENPTMAVCTHRSHLDYILLGMILHRLQLCNLRFAAGDNLTNMPILGQRFRSLGAFTVYRANSHKRSYIFELTRKVMEMLDTRDNIIVFPEGGRSYNGKMLEIKGGILAANILAQSQSPERKYVYLPTAISYEQLPEVPYFKQILRGKVLRKNNSRFIKKMTGNAIYFGGDIFAFTKLAAAKKFGGNYGDVYIDYTDPIPVNDIVDIKKNYSPNARNEFFAHKTSIKAVGNEIRRQLFKLYRLLPMHVIAAILKESGPCAIDLTESKVNDVMNELQKKNRNCKSLNPLSEKEIVEKGVMQLCHSKAITFRRNILKPRYSEILDYYAASIE